MVPNFHSHPLILRLAANGNIHHFNSQTVRCLLLHTPCLPSGYLTQLWKQPIYFDDLPIKSYGGFPKPTVQSPKGNGQKQVTASHGRNSQFSFVLSAGGTPLS